MPDLWILQRFSLASNDLLLLIQQKSLAVVEFKPRAHFRMTRGQFDTVPPPGFPILHLRVGLVPFILDELA